mmetsp:Transcript_22012/g.48095  ORF Transcript_22012/g.48095 Transcript_22012/m.48095 type:complete len:526 (+) Transcript_22012:119-1696(+)|eukprot:CAMPEP_0206458390 /NCGR_PEP_ID=MMETSP0324_2-20121206/23541_1 /ASSEMBLY_ACC=CAM_ASM_000836 /TAXON_ID=2866 /ORGANISM="Crypthecodinium cohnii, Strain Seligo" /LENGTH=525 /DNA_ID=CAMNT_0053929719 /DNA_START=44 /DNA_END=1621 /DNA_ORIENTATION=-
MSAATVSAPTLRQRRDVQGEEPRATRCGTPRSATPQPKDGPVLTKPNPSLLKARCLKDVLARVALVGYFFFEALQHMLFFEEEIQTMVIPALSPLPREAAVALQSTLVIFGLCGSIVFVTSAFDFGGRNMLTMSTSWMLVYLAAATWVWWINREGVPYWSLDAYPFWDVRCSAEKRNRTVHILKNLSIMGSLKMYQYMAIQEMEEKPEGPSFLDRMMMSLRLWTNLSTLGPQFVIIAVLQCHLGLALPAYGEIFLLVTTLCSIQLLANLVNSYRDFENGVDTVDFAGDRTMVDNLVSLPLLKGFVGLFVAWWIAYFVRSLFRTNFHTAIIFLPALGLFFAIGYTAGPTPLKYVGLGDLTVFLSFGPAVIPFSSAILCGQVPFQAMLLGSPVALYSVAVLHANNHRDRLTDVERGVRTVAVRLGHERSERYYQMLVLGTHFLGMAAGLCVGCYGVLGSLAALPQSLWLCARISRKEMLIDQDQETAKGCMMFGVAHALGIALMPGAAVTTAGLGTCALVVLIQALL